MEYLITFIISFTIIFLMYLVCVISKKTKYEKYKKGKQLQFFIRKYNLKFKNIKEGTFITLLSLVNSFVMALTIMIIVNIKNIIIKFLLAFVVLIVLLLLCYSLIGIYIEKKEGK